MPLITTIKAGQTLRINGVRIVPDRTVRVSILDRSTVEKDRDGETITVARAEGDAA